MKKIPIVFTFNEMYALGGSVAIMSLLDNRNVGTEYEIFIFYDYFEDETVAKLKSLSPIHFVKVPNDLFEGFTHTPRFPLIGGYNMLIPDLLKDYERVIFSDADVLILKDLSHLMDLDLDDYYWAGVSISKKDNFFCQKYPVLAQYCQDNYYSNGFMVVNEKKIRENNIGLEQFRAVAKKYGKLLYFVDQDIWNIVCNKVYRLPPGYLFPDFIYRGRKSDVVWHCDAYDMNIDKHFEDIFVVHCCTENLDKIWTLPEDEIYPEYLHYMIKSPLYQPYENRKEVLQ